MQHPARGAATLVATLLAALVIAAAAPPPAAATMVTEKYTAYSTAKGVGQADIDGDKVVWAGKNTAGVWKVGWGTIDTTTNIILPWPAPLRAVTQTHPAVSGDWIVWQEKSGSGDWDIAGRQYSAPGGDVKICQAPGDQMLPRISGNVVVWQDHRNSTWDIYVQNVGAIVPGGTPLVKAAGNQTAPDVDASRVVWVDTRSGNADIWTLDPGPLTTRALVTNSARQDQPTISGHRVVWRDARNARGNRSDLYMHDLTSSTNSPLIRMAGNQSAPRLSDDMLVYNDYRSAALGKSGYGADIGFYDITLLEDFDIVAAKGNQTNPAIFGGTVLWSDTGVPATKPDSLHAAELTTWSAFAGVNGYSHWTNDPVCDLNLFAAHKLFEVPVAVTLMQLSNDGAFGPFPFEAYAETKSGWNLNGGLLDTDGPKKVNVTYRDAGAATSQTVTAEITLDRVGPSTTANSPVTVRSGGTARFKYKADDILSPRANATIFITNLAVTRTLKTLKCGWQPVGVWKTRSFTCTLSPGNYRFYVTAKDLAGNLTGLAMIHNLKVTK